MADYTIVPVADVPDMADEVGIDPDHFEIRFMRERLGLKNFAVTYERFGGGWRAPEGPRHRRGHRHTVQEEVYFLVSGRAQAKFDDEVVDIDPWTAVRVPPRRRGRFRAAGNEDAVFVSIAAPQAGLDDVEFLPDYWEDSSSTHAGRMPAEAEGLKALGGPTSVSSSPSSPSPHRAADSRQVPGWRRGAASFSSRSSP